MDHIPEIDKYHLKPDGYQQLKSFMIATFPIKKASEVLRVLDPSQFFKRKQLCHENILDYARNIHKLAQELFEGTTKLNDLTIKQFATGLSNMYAREVAWEKIGESKYTIKLDELAEFVQNKIEAKNRSQDALESGLGYRKLYYGSSGREILKKHDFSDSGEEFNLYQVSQL